MNTATARLIIQNTLKTGLALMGIAVGAAIVAASKQRLETNRVFKRFDESVKETARQKKNARRRELAAQKRALKKKVDLDREFEIPDFKKAVAK